MNYLYRWRQLATRRASVLTSRWYLPVAAGALAAALSLTMLPRGLSGAAQVSAEASPAAVTPAAAPNDDSVTWTPDGTPVQTKDGSGNCELAMQGTRHRAERRRPHPGR